ncbi:MAG: cysteine peptidase family C39 domain-containing protein, partial [Novosphingobium sp.]
MANARSADRPAIIAQRFDDDCGAAALVMLLQRAGVDISAEDLLAGLKPGASADALSAADLAGLVSALGQGLRLDVGFLPVPMAATLAESEPYLILIKPRSQVGTVAVDHFILVEGRAADGFLVADPDLPSRVRLTDSAFARDAHGKQIDGKPYAMVLKLSRNDEQIAQRVPSEPGDAHLLHWEQAYNLPRVLPAGKTAVSVGQLWQKTRVDDPASSIETRQDNNVTVLGLSRGIGHRTEIGLSLARFSGTGSFRLPGEEFTVERQGTFNATLSIRHVPAVALPQGFGMSTAASVEWSDSAAPSAGSISADIQWAKAGFVLGVDTTLRHDREFSAFVTPTISYRLPVRRLFLLDSRMSATYRI